MAQTLKKIYSDIDFSFKKTPGRNDIALSYDEMAVIRSVRYILLTNNYERPFQPDIGSRINQLLFEPMSPITASTLRTEIMNTLKKYEPRIDIQEIIVDELLDENAYNVTLTFFIANNTTPLQINLVLERTR